MRAQSECQNQLAGRQIARSSAQHLRLRVASGAHTYDGANAVAIRFRSDQLNTQAMILRAGVAEQSGRTAVGCEQQIKGPVVVDIAVGRASCHTRRSKRRPRGCGHLFEFSVAEIMKKVRRLRIADARLNFLDGIFNVSVRDVNIKPTVQIVVEKEATESKSQQACVA